MGQVENLKLLVDYFKSVKVPKLYMAASPQFWLVHWTANSFGYFSLLNKLKFKFNYGCFLKKVISNIINLSKLGKFKFLLPDNYFQASHIVMSWCSKKNINKIVEDLWDPYFGLKTSKLKSDFLYIYLATEDLSSEDIKKLIDAGCGVICHERAISNPFYVFYLYFSYSKILGFKSSLYVLNYDFCMGEKLWKAIYKNLKNTLLLAKSISFPYEAQPFQNRIIFEIKAISKATIVGYVHSAIHNFPSFMIKREGSPNLLFTHGQGTKRVLAENCGWKKESLILTRAFRFTDQKKEEFFYNKIFLPYFFKDPFVLIDSIEKLFVTYKLTFDFLEVRIHPDFYKDNKHLSLKENINAKIAKYGKENSKVKRTIVMGTTSTVLECLEAGVLEVFHIVERPELDMYNEAVWPELKITKLDAHIALYSLKNRGSFIDFKSIDNCRTFEEKIVETIDA